MINTQNSCRKHFNQIRWGETGYLCYPNVPQGSLPRIYFNERRKRKGSTWVSNFQATTEVAPATPLRPQNHLLPTTYAGIPKLQPAQGPQHRGCSMLSAIDLKGSTGSLWSGDCCAYSSMAWPGEKGSCRDTWKATTTALENWRQ